MDSTKHLDGTVSNGGILHKIIDIDLLDTTSSFKIAVTEGRKGRDREKPVCLL